MNTKRHITTIRSPARQRGAVLFVALIILILLTLLGISNMQTGILEEKMTGAFNDRNNLAFESAEMALRDAEDKLNNVTLGTVNASQGLHSRYPNGANPSFWLTRPVSASSPACTNVSTATAFNWLQTGTAACSSIQLATGRKLPGTAEAPRYVVEELATVPKTGSSVKAGVAKESTKVYRITARGVGAQPTTVVILQSTFKR